MGVTSIEWTSTVGEDGRVHPGYSFNAWRGCTKVSQGCLNCYAETLSGRNPRTLGVWGPSGSRPVASDAYWRGPLHWDQAAKAAGQRRRVFCASLADVFEGEETMPPEAREAITAARLRLFGLIDATPNLDWLLLTKRPENIERLWPFGWYGDQFAWPNLWLGTSVEDQATADVRIPELMKMPAAVRFLSCEPLLGPVDLTPFRSRVDGPGLISHGSWGDFIHWVICGGESGPGARPMHPDWARSLRDQCVAAGVPFHFKQWGEWIDGRDWPPYCAGLFRGETREVTQETDPDRCRVITLCRVGKKAAGRVLDGAVWDQFPEPRQAVAA